MDKGQIDDLKQFIETLVYQSLASMKTELIDELSREMKNGFKGIADIFDVVVNPQLDNHEERITKIEKQTV